MRRPLALVLAATGAIVLLAPAPAGAATARPEISRYRVFDAGSHVTWQLRICAKSAGSVRFVAELESPREVPHHFRTWRARQRKGCYRWTMTAEDVWPVGTWRSRLKVTFGRAKTRSTRWELFFND